MSEEKATRFEGLDILRGLAAIYVVLSHYTSFCLRELGDTPFYIPRETGDYAVWLFFIISGFVIYFSIERSKTWRDFAVSRLTRLYPMYWITLTIVLVASIYLFAKERMWWGGYLVNMTMFQEFFGFENFDNVYWSLTVELAFYLIVGLLFKAGWIQRIGMIATAWLLLAWIGTLLGPTLDGTARMILHRYFIIAYVPFFLMGIMLYLIQKRGISGQRVLIIIASFATIGLIHGWGDLAISLALFAAAAFSISRLGRFLVSPVLLWLGAISYALYLIHRNLGYLALNAMHRHGVSTPMALAIAVTTALILATLLTYLVERPLCAYLRKLYRQRYLS